MLLRKGLAEVYCMADYVAWRDRIWTQWGSWFFRFKQVNLKIVCCWFFMASHMSYAHICSFVHMFICSYTTCSTGHIKLTWPLFVLSCFVMVCTQLLHGIVTASSLVFKDPLLRLFFIFWNSKGYVKANYNFKQYNKW